MIFAKQIYSGHLPGSGFSKNPQAFFLNVRLLTWAHNGNASHLPD